MREKQSISSSLSPSSPSRGSKPRLSGGCADGAAALGLAGSGQGGRKRGMEKGMDGLGTGSGWGGRSSILVPQLISS